MTVRTKKIAETKAKANVKNGEPGMPDPSIALAGPSQINADERHSQAKSASPLPASRPRQRKVSKSNSNKSNSNKHGRGWSEFILRMPTEVFAEIAYHLQPADLVSLSRTNKFFRGILMSRLKAAKIWQMAEQNVDGLPPCPPGLCEPQYAAFMFVNACSECGTYTPRRMDPYLWVRLCPGCRDKLIIKALDPIENIDLVSKSNVATSHKTTAMWYCLKRDLDAVKFEMDAVSNAESIMGKDPLVEWRKERSRMLKERTKVARQIISYYKSQDAKRKDDRSTIVEQRRIEIERRLREAGWSTEDLDFPDEYAHPWIGFVSEAKAITERVWTNLYPKLVECIERKRDACAKRDLERRHVARRSRIHAFLFGIRSALGPVVQVNVQLSEEDMQPGLASTPLNGPIRFLPEYKLWATFPSTAQVFAWDEAKEWLEGDITVEAAEAQFEERRGIIQDAIRGWQAKVEKDVLEIWRKTPDARPEKIEPIIRHYGQLPPYTATYGKPDGGTTRNIKELPSDTQLLLRADTVFKSLDLIRAAGSLFHTRGVVFYPTFVPGPTGREVFETGKLKLGWTWDPSRVERHEQGSHVARVLLACLNLPDATYAELAALGDRFTCARCCEVMPESWELLITHFLIEQEIWERGQKGIAAQPGCGLIYRNVHDLDFETSSRPLVKILTTQEAKALRTREALPRSQLIQCRACQSIGTYCDLYPEAWAGHYMDVHGITNPPPPPIIAP